MLSGQIKIIVFIFLLFTALLLVSGCESEKPKPEDTLNEYLKQEGNARLFLEKNLGLELRYGFYLPLTANDTYRFCYLEEEDSFAEWGIRFVLAELQDTLPVVIYTSPVFDGSLKESAVRPVRLPGYTYDLIFYNSGSYFLGSGGGEVYSYLADFEEKTFTPCFLEVSGDGSVVLSFPGDAPEELRQFFIREFKKDYPMLIVEPDGNGR